MDILSKSAIEKMSDNDSIDGLVYLKSYTKQPTKNGGSFIGGVLEAKGTVQFKAWSNSNCYATLMQNDMKGTICRVSGQVNYYGGTISLIINSIWSVDREDLKVSDFFEPKYDAIAYFNTLEKTVKHHISGEASDIFDAIFNEKFKERFLVEFAAVSHHDNCVSGLLAHTTKVVRIATLVRLYPALYERLDKDLLFLGSAIHDIGKTVEYKDGVISPVGVKMSHLTIGVFMLLQYRDLIVEKKGEDFFNGLIAIIQQHHGEYGDAPRTLESYVISQLDLLDSTLTSLNQNIESHSDDEQIKFFDYKLS